MNVSDLDRILYRVVVDHEEQHSIWPLDRALPLGWWAEGFEGERTACLDHIEKIWTDMRPLSLRKAMEDDGARSSM